MKTFKLLFLLLLATAVFGPAAYFGYELFIKPSRVEKAERSAPKPAPTPTPTPDTGASELRAIKEHLPSGTPAANRDALNAWITGHPDSPLLTEARSLLGSLNISLLLHPAAGEPGATSYTVVKGDSLAKIASKFHSNAELIQQANSLPGIALQIGQVLVIPTPQVSLELDRKTRTLTLLDKGAFIREYPLLASPAAPRNPTPPTTTKVLDKIVTAAGKRIAFGDRNYPSGERLILLGQAPAISGWTPPPTATPATQTTGPSSTSAAGNDSTSSLNAPAPALTPVPMPGGYVLASPDLRELFPLVSRNTPVTIR